jgi:signal transduction histidine kinase
MRGQKAFLDGVVTHAQACIAVMGGPEMRCSFVNPAYQALVPDTPLPGQRYRDVFPDAARAGVEQQLHKVLKSGQPWRIEQFPVVIPGKPEALWEGQAVPLPTAEDEQSLLVIVWYITERAQAELSLQASAATLHAVLNATQESVWLFSNDGTILMGNQTAAARLAKGISAMQRVGNSLREYLPPELANTRLGYLQTVVKSGKPLEFEDQNDGVQYQHSAYPVCSLDGQVARVASFSRDITLERKASQALKAAIDEADRANNAKSRFMAAASHDLRQPLSALSVYLGALKKRMGEEHAELFGSIKECLNRLSELLSDLLDLSKLQAQVVTPKVRDFEVADLLANTCAANMPQAQKKTAASEVVGCWAT